MVDDCCWEMDYVFVMSMKKFCLQILQLSVKRSEVELVMDDQS